MKKIVLILSPIVATAILIGCAKEKSIKPQAQNQQTVSETTNLNARLAVTKSNFTGEDLFAGIFYLKGSVVNEVDVLVDLKANLNNGELQVLSLRADNVINEINSVNPTFFNQFKDEILKGDNQSVLSGIDNAIQLLTDLDIENGNGPSLLQADGGKKKSKWIIINHILIKRSKPFKATDDEFVVLEKEQLVNSIVSSLK